MIFVALAVLALAALVLVGRWPMLARQRGRWPAWALAGVAAAAAAYDATRGGWLGGSILASTALWVATSSLRPPRQPSAGGMTRAEAAAMLGVAEGAGRAEVEAAYRRLMLRVHPDVGGASGLAARLNDARAVMLTAAGG
jgi:hypothetical protein